MADLNATRRTMLGALAASGAMAAAGAVSISAAPTLDYASWASAMEAYKQADAAEDRYDAGPWQAAHDAFERTRPQLDDVDFYAFNLPDRSEVAHRVDLDAYWSKFVAGEGKWWWPGQEPGARERVIARHKASFDSVRSFRERWRQADLATGWTAANEESDRLTERRCDAEEALFFTPAPDLPSVSWKVAFARKRWALDVDWPEPWWDALNADLHRLAGGLN